MKTHTRKLILAASLCLSSADPGLAQTYLGLTNFTGTNGATP